METFHFLSNVQENKIVPLNNSTHGQVAVSSVTYTVGWYNINSGYSFEHLTAEPPPVEVIFQPGLYNFSSVKKIITDTVPGSRLTVDRNNGKISFILPLGHGVRFSEKLGKMLGLDEKGWLSVGTHTGDRAIDFAPVKALYVHLEQLDWSNNFVDGKRSSLLCVVPLENDMKFGDTHTINFSLPKFKRLAGVTNELRVSIRDSDGNVIITSNSIHVELIIR